jgi:fatty acid desaturase
MAHAGRKLPLPKTAGWLLRYSTWDLLPIVGGLAHLGFIAWTCYAFATLSWWGVAAAFVLSAVAYCWNLQCVAHNFIHNPFFTSDTLNRLYCFVETLTLGVPHLVNHHYHMAHHYGDNDYPGPDGTTKDWASIFRYGKDRRPENFWKYSLLSYFRADLGLALGRIRRHGRGQVVQVALEFVAIGALWLTMLAYDWRFFVCLFLPSYYVGWVLIYMEGYLEHYGGQPGNYYANSVSCYNWWYNVLTFNNGYHQEHHWDPKAHWTAMQNVHAEIKPQLIANRTRILRGPHITALIEDWWYGRKEGAAEEARRAA